MHSIFLQMNISSLLIIQLLPYHSYFILLYQLQSELPTHQNYAYQSIAINKFWHVHVNMDHDLSHEQYEKVLKYMETTSQQNFESAINALKKFNFQLDNAVSAKFNMHDEPDHRQDHGYAVNHHEENQQTIRASKNLRIQEDVKRYLQYLKQKQNKSLIGGIYNFTKNFLVGLVSGLTEFLLPEFLLRKIYRSNFYNMYQSRVLPEFRDKKLNYILKNSKLERKPIMFVISANDTVHECLIKLLNRPEIARKINQSFIFSGATSDDKQCSQLEGERTPPSIIFCRKNIFEQVEIVRRVIGETSIIQLDVDKLNYILRDHQRATRKDRNVLIRYRNYIRRNYYGSRPGYYQQEEEEEDLYYPTAQYDKPTAVSEMIKKQNEEYQKVQQESRRKESIELMQKEKQKEEEKKHMELQEERRVRKMSIPDEPVEGDIIRFSFRLPDGSTKTRSFNSEQNMDLLYHWVETNDEIEFEDNKKREFELLYGFPPSSLSSRRDSKLKNIFESDQEKILIREM